MDKETIKEIKEISVFLGAVVLALFLSVSVIICSIEYLGFDGKKVEIEKLRSEIQNVEASQRAMIYDRALKVNMDIASYRKYNSMWWSCVYVPNGWDKIEYISLAVK